ncbi:MAG TPA: AsmA family protein [Xanthomonadaceae bacterium]|jgi:hypothetical protein
MIDKDAIDKDVEQPGVPAGEEQAPAVAPQPRRRLVAWTALLMLALIALLIALFDWNWFKPLVERRVTAATGREFHIDGDLDVRLSMQPLITVDRLRLGNVPHASTPTMASADRLRLRVLLWPLLHGHTEIPELRLVKPAVHLESDASGHDNWNFPPTSSGPVIRRFTIEDGLLTYRDALSATDVRIQVESDRQRDSSRLAPLRFQGDGYYRNNPLTLQGTADSPLELARTTTPYRMDLSATADKTRIHAQGALRNPLQLNGFDLDFAIDGPDMALLFPLFGIATPETPPYRLRGRLGHSAHVWSFERFQGFVGNSDLAGDVSIDNRGPRKLLSATLSSRRLDVHDLAGFVGAPAHANPAKATTAKQKTEAVQAQASERVLPQHAFDLGRIRGMDADVVLKALKVTGTPVPLGNLDARMQVQQGVLRLDPMDFAAAGGKVRSKVQLDASRGAIAATARVGVRNVQLGQIVPDAPAMHDSTGRIAADVDLKGNGNSVAAMLATSDGKVDAGMGGGRISDLLMAYAGLDLARILKLKITGDHDIAIRCVVADFDAHKGIWNARTLAFDSTDTLILGSGDIDLGNERFDLRLRVKPKRRSPLSLRAPLQLTGTFAQPSIHPELKAIGVRGVAAVVLGAIAPPAAELAFIDVGGGKDSDCAGPGSTKPSASGAADSSRAGNAPRPADHPAPASPGTPR